MTSHGLIPRRGKKSTIAILWLQLILGLGLGLVLNAAIYPPVQVRAQSGAQPFPGTLVVEDTWPAIRPDHKLISLGRNRILEWAPVSGQYRIWHYDPAVTTTAGLFPGRLLAVGRLDSNQADQELVYLGGSNLLIWEPVSGRYWVQRYAPAAAGQADPLAAPAIVRGTWPTLRASHDLVYLGSGKLLAWEPASGHYRLWRYDPTLSGTVDGFPGELLAAGTWPMIRLGHELVYLGNNRILDWQPASGQYRIWRYDLAANGPADPLSAQPVAQGTLPAVGPEHELLSLGENWLLAWEPATGHYRVWHYELAAVGAFTLEDIATRLGRQNISGVTIITHGFQPFDDGGDALMPLAEAIHAKAGGWLLDYDVPDDGAGGFFDTCTNDCGSPSVPGSGELVLLFDWAPESNQSSAGWGEAAGDALFSMLAGLGLVDPRVTANVPLHFIGHSFGTAVISEAVERLARFEVPVDQVTYLDPHDFDQANVPVDEAQRLFDLGQPPGYGAAIWHNVTFADVYYQTQVSFFLEPEGRPIPGAYAKSLNELIAPTVGLGPHTYVWHCFYRGTVLGQTPPDCAAPQQPVDYSQTGYAFSRIKNSAARPAPNFYAAGQDHVHSEPSLVDPVSGEPNDGGLAGLGLTADQVVQGRWAAAWNPLTIVNGDFEQVHDSGTCGLFNTCIQPGWAHHGGGGEGHFDADHTVHLELDVGSTGQAHNWLYVPAKANQLQFDLWRVDGPSGSADQLEVRLGDQILVSYELREGASFEDGNFITHRVAVPDNLRGQVKPLTFGLVGVDVLDGSEVRVDNVGFVGAEVEPIYLVFLPVTLKP